MTIESNAAPVATWAPEQLGRGVRGLAASIVVALLVSGSVHAYEKTDPEIPAMVDTIDLFEFRFPEEPWTNIDDVVMGGVSSSRMRFEDACAIFEGELSLENNGGFASVRSKGVQADLDDFAGIRLRINGDGNTYQLRIRTNANYDGPSYQVTFETRSEEWTEIDLPFADFKASFRGRSLPDYPKLDPSKISTFGILITDKQEGPFKLNIDRIKAYRVDAGIAATTLEGAQS